MTIEPNFAHWDRIDPLRLCDVANLWVGIPPLVTPDVMPAATPIWLWLQQELRCGHLVCAEGQLTPFDKFPYLWATRVSLRVFAEQHGERPAFLFPEDRDSKIKVIAKND
ncbi:MAG: hypothetical protein ACR2RF_25495 [Geminicoccaceae bacterium]